MPVSVRVSALVLILAAASTAPSAQSGTEVRIWTARAIATVLAEIGPQFEQATGAKLNVISDLSSGFASPGRRRTCRCDRQRFVEH